MSDTQAQIIFVDDDPIALFLHDTIMHDCAPRCAPQCFELAQAALSLIVARAKCNTSFLIFLDINMPGMDGWAFLESLSQCSLHGSAQVVMLTSSVEVADRKRAESFDIVLDFLEKPFSQAQVIALKSRHELAEFFQPIDGKSLSCQNLQENNPKKNVR